MTSTLRTRFVNFVAKAPWKIELEAEKPLLAFIASELELLAEECEKADLTGRNWGVKEAVSIIREKIKEIKL